MANSQKNTNQKMLNEAGEIQHKTKDALDRIKRDVQETKEMGTETLEQLRTQEQQMVLYMLLFLLLYAFYK